MENLRITIETWGGNTSPEQLADAVAIILQGLSKSKQINCVVEGADFATASYASTLLVRDKGIQLDEARVTKHGALSIKHHPQP